MIRINTLGCLDVRDTDGADVTSLLRHPKRVALLSYLAVARPRGFHSRDILLSVFWPEHDTSHARMSLRQGLYALRCELGSDVIVTHGAVDVALNRDRCLCDATEFDAAVAAGELDGAVALYQGPFLDGLFLSGVPEFERWVEVERDRLARAYSEALENLAGQARDNVVATKRWRQLADHDPYNSRATLQLMKALATAGDRTAAIQVAVKHTSLLQNVLETNPDPEVLELARQLRTPRSSEPKANTLVRRSTSDQPITRVPPKRHRRSFGIALMVAAGASVIVGSAMRSKTARLFDGSTEPSAVAPATDANMGDSLLNVPLDVGALLALNRADWDSLFVAGVEEALGEDLDSSTLELTSTGLTVGEALPELSDADRGIDPAWTVALVRGLKVETRDADGDEGAHQPGCIVVRVGEGPTKLEQCGVIGGASGAAIVLMDKNGIPRKIIR